MQNKNIQLHLLVSQNECDLIKNRMSNLGINNMSAYLRKMAIDGYMIQLDLSEIKEVISLLRRCSNNLNQYAKQANKTGHIYIDDIQDIKKQINNIWEAVGTIINGLSQVL